MEGLARRFGDTSAVDGLTLSVERGEIFGLVGPDGAGKTTTMRLLTAILDPTAGDAWVLGHSVRGDAAEVKEDRLHEPAVRPVRRPDRAGEPPLLRRPLRRSPPRPGGPHRRAARLQQPGPVPAPPRGESLRRDEAEAGAGLRPRPHAPGALPGRAHQRRGPRLPARLLADPVPSPPGGGDDLRLHRLPRRGGAVPPGRTPSPRKAPRGGDAGGGALPLAGDAPGDPVRGSEEGPPRPCGRRSPPPPWASSATGSISGRGTSSSHAAAVESALAAAAVPFDSVLPIPPSLEDVFVSVLGRDGGGAA